MRLFNHTYVHLHNYFTHCARIGWGLGTEDNVLNFQSAMIYTNNLVFVDLRIMAVVFVILLTPKYFSRPASSPAHASFVAQIKTCGAGSIITSLAS